MIDFDQDRNAADTPLSEHPLDSSYELSRNPLTTLRRVNYETVHVAAPPVVGSKQRGDDLVPEDRQQKDRRRMCSNTAYLFDFVGNANGRARFFPESKNPFCVAWRCVPELHLALRTSVVLQQFVAAGDDAERA
jgi:hypothetical protein